MSTPEDATADLTQLMRYVLTIDNMNGPEDIALVREQLLRLGLIVDQVAVGEMEVATVQADGPDLKAIRVALEQDGYHLAAAVAKVG